MNRRLFLFAGFIQGGCGAPNFDRPGISTEAQAFSILMESAGNGAPFPLASVGI